jgi:hypothetical protein
VLVFERPGSVSCHFFRRDLLPKYHRLIRAEAPLRFIDVSSDGAADPTLNARIDVVPTAVVIRDGREIDRIVGPGNFFRLRSYIQSRLEEQSGGGKVALWARVTCNRGSCAGPDRVTAP